MVIERTELGDYERALEYLSEAQEDLRQTTEDFIEAHHPHAVGTVQKSQAFGGLEFRVESRKVFFYPRERFVTFRSEGRAFKADGTLGDRVVGKSVNVKVVAP